MEENKITDFCEECRDYVDCIVEEKELIGTLIGKQYHYMGKEVKCSVCGAYVWVDEIIDSNLKSLYDVYHKENS